MKVKAYRTTATTTIKKLARKRVPKMDVYDDTMLDAMDDLASKWAMRVDRLRQQQDGRRLSV